MNNQTKLSNQLKELLKFTDRWDVIHNNKDFGILLSCDYNGLLIKGKEINYIVSDKDKPVEEWDMLKLKYSSSEFKAIKKDIDKIVNR